MYTHDVHSSVFRISQEMETFQMLINWQIYKQNVLHILYIYNGYYSVIIRKEILTHVRTWMHLEDIMSSELS